MSGDQQGEHDAMITLNAAIAVLNGRYRDAEIMLGAEMGSIKLRKGREREGGREYADAVFTDAYLYGTNAVSFSWIPRADCSLEVLAAPKKAPTANQFREGTVKFHNARIRKKRHQ